MIQFECLGHPFCANLSVLPLGGCDMVLGVDWLKQLGDVVFNLTKLSISFLHCGNRITLQGGRSTSSFSMISGASVKKFIKSHTPAIFGKFFSISATPIAPIPSLVSQLLDSFADVFAEPTSLPPPRVVDHRIILKPNTEPTSQRPYRCPYVQKAVVEQLMHEMLSTGLIQDNHTPFASHIYW